MLKGATMLMRLSAVAVVLLLISGFAAIPALSGEPKVVVAEHFGATWASYCEYARCALQMLEDEFGDEFIHWKTHRADAYATPEGDARAAWYGVTGVPHVFFDGRDDVLGAADCDTAYIAYRDLVTAHLAENGGLSPIEIDGVYSYTGGSVEVGLLFRLLDPVSLHDLRGTIVVYEDNVESQWPNVTRAIIDEDVTLAVQYDEDHMEASIPVDAMWDPASIKVAAYIQTVTGNKEIYQGFEVPLEPGFTITFDHLVRSVPYGNFTAVFDALLTNGSDEEDTFTLMPGTSFGDWATDFLVCGDPNPHTNPVEVVLGPYESCEIDMRVQVVGPDPARTAGKKRPNAPSRTPQ